MHEINTQPPVSPQNSSLWVSLFTANCFNWPSNTPMHCIHTDVSLRMPAKATPACSKHHVLGVRTRIGYKHLTTTQTLVEQHSISFIKTPSPHFIWNVLEILICANHGCLFTCLYCIIIWVAGWGILRMSTWIAFIWRIFNWNALMLRIFS